MANAFRNNRSQNESEFHYYEPSDWVTQITYAISAGITRVVIVAISLVTTVLILAGGVWLLYTYVPADIYNIIIAVLLVDILLGIMVRYFVLRRRRRNSR